MGIDQTGVDKTGVDQTGVDKTGVDEMETYQIAIRGLTSNLVEFLPSSSWWRYLLLYPQRSLLFTLTIS